jgi:hypothetical protein
VVEGCKEEGVSVKLRLLSIAAALCLSIAISAGPGFAQAEEIKREPEPVRRMLQEGWTKVAEGVLQRIEWGRPVETFTYGEDGLRWSARKLEARIERLQKEFESYPSAELVGILQSLESHLRETEEVLASGAAGAEVVSSEELAACVFDGPQPTVTAGPKTGPDAPGVKANATISFHSSCGGIGNSYAYAYARATPPGGEMDDDPQEDTKYDSALPVTATASASASGSLDCFSEAFAEAWNSDFDYVAESTPNYSCPLPVTASISGPSEVLLVGGCKTVTWSASATGGSGAYSYKWYLGTGTVVVSARSTYSRTYCQATQVDLRIVATDTSSPAQADDATFTTLIH